METKFQNLAPFCSLIRGCCLCKPNTAQLYLPGVLSADAQPVAKAVPIALELPREWLMLPPQDYYKLNHRTTRAGRDCWTHLIQPASPARVRQCTPGCSGFFSSWISKNSRYIDCTAPLDHCLSINCLHSDVFSFISHMNIPISAWSNTGCSIPGCQEWHVMGNTTFPGSACWAPPDTAQHPAHAQGTGRAYRSWYRRLRSPRGKYLQKQLWCCPAPSTFPLHLEKLAQSLPSGYN